MIKSQAIIECLTLKNVDNPYTRDWNIPNFSRVQEYWTSEEFSDGDHKWYCLISLSTPIVFYDNIGLMFRWEI